MRYLLLALAGLTLTLQVTAQQEFPYQLTLEPVIPAEFKGLQSYAWARSGDMILLVGGRTDGLHRRQPFASFSNKYNNTELIVLDIKNEKTWKRSLTGLPLPVAEQLQSSNMEFFQDGDQLILVGGYGYSGTEKDHITFPSLTRIRVNELVDAVIRNKELTSHIVSVKDERMAVTGGRLSKLSNRYYLVGGQRFDGRYNPHGPDHGPGFSQQYTNQVRIFSLAEKDNGLVIENYSAITDTALLHRRDYNLLNQYDENGKEMLTIYSGVFQYNKDLPFTTLVDISGNTIREVPGFNQRFCHYHSASLTAYDPKNQTHYSIFFGGIARQYADSAGTIVTDNDVPFVKHISVVERKGDSIREYLLPEKLTGYFGAAAEFIPANEKLFSDNNILRIEKAGKKAFLAGYIIGGIDSRAPNVFWSNAAEPSRASPVIWKVILKSKN
jgi:hypothetical protein